MSVHPSSATIPPQGGHQMPQYLDVFIGPISDNQTVQEGE